MKGVIFLALREMVENKHGENKWNEVLEVAAFSGEPTVLAADNFDDAKLMKVFGALSSVLKLSAQQVYDEFGDYWINVYAPRVYWSYYTEINDAKTFLSRMDEIHVKLTKNVLGSKPPRFEYEWKNDKTFIMRYISERELIDLMVGLIKGVGKHYKEELYVRKLSNEEVEINFL
jgi:hypothetical protein